MNNQEKILEIQLEWSRYDKKLFNAENNLMALVDPMTLNEICEWIKNNSNKSILYQMV